MRFAPLLLVLCVSTAHASTEDAWFAGLTTRVVADLKDGKPLSVEVHVPLCDTSIIPCGNAKLGDGENPETNLYWATTPGFGRWFTRHGWKRTAHETEDTGDKDVLVRDVYRRTVQSSSEWRKAGAPKTFEIELVVRAWRGTAIDRALAAYAKDMSNESGAHIVAWVGHNRLMDLSSFEWPAPPSTTKGTIAIACHTAAYMEDNVPAATRVPLLMTKDFLFSNAAPFEAAVLAFASGRGYVAIRADATKAYAEVQKRPLNKLGGVFTNPSDRRWKHAKSSTAAQRQPPPSAR